MKKRLILTAISLLAAGSIISANAQTRPMSLRECMEYAISNSTKIRIREATVGDARIARRDAILAAFTPSISGSSYAYYNFGRAVDPQTNTYITTTTFHNSYSLSAGITLFDGFKSVNNIKIAKTSLAMGLTEQEQAEADICLATMQAYCNAVYFTQLAQIYEKQAATARRMLEGARKEEQLGLKSRPDVAQMEADLAAREYDCINASNMRDDAMMTLEDVIFWPMDSKLTINSDMETQAASALIVGRSPEEIVSFALANQPGMKIALGNLDNARRELNTARWQTLPTINLYSGWSTTYFCYPGGIATDPFRNQLKNNGGEYLQLSISIPIYNRLSTASNISRKKNAYKRADAEYDQKARDVSSEVRRAVQDRDGASAAYLGADRKAKMQEEAYHLSCKQFEQGLISPIEYSTATDKYLAANADRLNMLLQLLIKKSVVEYYAGTKYTEQNIFD